MSQQVYSAGHRGVSGSGIALTRHAPTGSNQQAASYDLVKRWMDIIGASVGLLVLTPLLLLIASLLRVSSTGSILYRRRVLANHACQGGELRFFDAYKFRTMVVGAEEMLHADPALRREYEKLYKLAHDPRVTRLGRILRRYHLDELPQLVNVLQGEMSLVGPRIISAPELALYGSDAARLLSVRPGLTGLWQISDRRDAPYAERVYLDMTYIENRSLWLDLAILLRTAGYLLTRGRGHVAV